MVASTVNESPTRVKHMCNVTQHVGILGGFLGDRLGEEKPTEVYDQRGETPHKPSHITYVISPVNLSTIEFSFLEFPFISFIFCPPFLSKEPL